MNPRPGFKLIAVFALFLNIGADIILFGSLKNMISGANHANLITFLSFIFIIVFSFLLFLIFMISGHNEPGIDLQTELSIEKKEDKDDSDKNIAAESIINLEELRKKAVSFIPRGALVADENYSSGAFAEETLSRIAEIYPIVAGLFYLNKKGSDEFNPVGYYAYYSETKPSGFKLGETLPGQVAKNMKPLNISDIPENYIKVASGLGKSNPRHLYFLPIIVNEQTIAVIELASFKEFDKECETVFDLAAIELAKTLVQIKDRNL